MRAKKGNFLFALIIMLALFLLYESYMSTEGASRQPKQFTYSELYEQVGAGKVSAVEIEGVGMKGTLHDGSRFVLTMPQNDPDIYRYLREHKVGLKIKDVSGGSWWVYVLNFGPLILIVVFFMVMMGRMQGGGSSALTFGRSKAKLTPPNQKKVTFEDVAGAEEAKGELQEVVQFLREPGKFQRLGGRIPRGVLLIGPPGTGKTLLARAVAGEANVPFYSISGSDFVEMFVGVGASRVRDLFEQGKRNAPCIIFIDEIDAVGRHRGAGFGGGHDEREQTLNALLVEMDGFDANEGIIVVAATNRPDVLDPALLRPGRFDRRVMVERPDVRGREATLLVHTRSLPLADGVDLGVVARGTPGFTGADLANLVNEAALEAARRGRPSITQADLEFAKDKVLMGVEHRSMALSNEERQTTAYHEAGHALVAACIEHADPLHKVTIIPRGMALGLTMQLPEGDKHTYSQEYLESRLAVMMGGRAAEKIIFHHLTTGASNDIEQATEIASKMVREWGMSELGPLKFGTGQENPFLGKQIMEQVKDYSEKTAQDIDAEVKKLVLKAYERAKNILNSRIDALKRIAEMLLERETLDGEEIKKLILQTGRPS